MSDLAGTILMAMLQTNRAKEENKDDQKEEK